MTRYHSTRLRYNLQLKHSKRLRRRRDEVKQQFVKNRRSGEFGYRVDSSNNMEDIGDNFDVSVVRNYKDDTLDPTKSEDHIKHNLRPLIRSKYKLTDFGMIDRPQTIHDNSMR